MWRYSSLWHDDFFFGGGGGGLICGLRSQKQERPSFYEIPKIVTYLGCVRISGWKIVFFVKKVMRSCYCKTEF